MVQIRSFGGLTRAAGPCRNISGAGTCHIIKKRSLETILEAAGKLISADVDKLLTDAETTVIKAA